MQKSSGIQHLVPRFLIKNFSDRDGRVFLYSVQTGTINKLPPKYIASEFGFYDFQTSSEDVSYELSLSRIESSAAPIIRSIVNRRAINHLSSEEKLLISNFIAVQSFRTKAFYLGLEDIERKNFGNIFSNIWNSAFIVSSDIADRQFLLMESKDNNHFYLGDHPVVLQNAENPTSKDGLGFCLKGVEAFLPLTPYLALYMPCAATTRTVIDGYERAYDLLTTTTASRPYGNFASLIIKQAMRVVSTSREIYKALKGDGRINASAANVENLNYLQCAWSSDYVYSCVKDFEFANKVFIENPEYKKVSRVRFSPIW
jgi:hypothetical protein